MIDESDTWVFHHTPDRIFQSSHPYLESISKKNERLKAEPIIMSQSDIGEAV
jgi:hypothetical protein